MKQSILYYLLALFLPLILANVNVSAQIDATVYIDELTTKSNFKNIETLIIEKRGISDDSIIRNCINLRKLTVNNQKSFEFTLAFCSLNKLKCISINTVKNLHFFDCNSDYPIDSLELVLLKRTNFLSLLNKFKSLQYLSIQSSFKGRLKLEKLTPLNHLRVLYLIDNKVDDLKTLGHFSDLESLLLCNNKLKSFALLDSLHNLKSLTLDINKLREFTGLLLTPNLLELSLGNNNLDKIPDEVTSLKKLRNLELANNRIKDFSNLIFLKNLNSLNLSNCELKRIPKELEYLNKIRELNLSNNKSLNIDITITELINHFNQLEELNISNCEINHVPNELSKLKNLKRLVISGNRLSSEQIKELRKKLPQCEVINIKFWTSPPNLL